MAEALSTKAIQRCEPLALNVNLPEGFLCSRFNHQLNARFMRHDYRIAAIMKMMSMLDI